MMIDLINKIPKA
jgi:adenosine deaminase